ncbi:hypothetical protein E2562_009811 [Oryza meyeriana var. granulata]|uniref:F-box protein At3g26010-like beta-propeller domain-containing protein n=1 Tax=Oryza meyeriana var. granulata TaxID=110450 RepID=A0A6G1BSR0_9ORYZ|nr:hypothetical protein E2562_009811 [Oryza meyeriana var. granulata]
MFNSDLTFVPGPGTREQAYLQQQELVGDDGARASGRRGIGGKSGGLFVVNSSEGLLLCSRGRERLNPVHYYVCNPQTLQWVALLELPWPPTTPEAGLLSLATDGSRFQVVLFDKRRLWEGLDLHMYLRVFSSDKGEWTAWHLPYAPLGVKAYAPPSLGRSGGAY